MQGRERRGFLLGFAFALAVGLAALTALIWFAGTSDALMARLMMDAAPPKDTRLPAELYAPLCAQLTGYLRSGEGVFDFLQGGISLFGATEKVHLADCASLFRLDRTVLWVSAGLSAILLGLSLLRGVGAKRWGRGVAAGALVCLALVIGLAIWSLADFDGLFITFHRVAFSNDLWLLNPATDLLIRLMPTGFFVRYAALLGGGWLIFLAVLFWIGWRMAREPKKRGGAR